MLVSDVMQATVLTITPKTTARSHTPGGQGRLIGIVTETDVLELFVRGMGAGQPTSRIDVRLAEDSATLADLVHAVEEARVAISSIMTLGDRSGHKDVVIRVRSMDPRAATARLEACGYTVRDPRKG